MTQNQKRLLKFAIQILILHCSAVRPYQTSTAAQIDLWHKNRGWKGIGICYEGGLDCLGRPADTRTPEQKKALRELLVKLRKQFPRAIIVGHRDLAPGRDCPCFDSVAEYRDLQP